MLPSYARSLTPLSQGNPHDLHNERESISTPVSLDGTPWAQPPQAGRTSQRTTASQPRKAARPAHSQGVGSKGRGVRGSGARGDNKEGCTWGLAFRDIHATGSSRCIYARTQPRLGCRRRTRSLQARTCASEDRRAHVSQRNDFPASNALSDHPKCMHVVECRSCAFLQSHATRP